MAHWGTFTYFSVHGLLRISHMHDVGKYEMFNYDWWWSLWKSAHSKYLFFEFFVI